jgi:hypothetical protein
VQNAEWGKGNGTDVFLPLAQNFRSSFLIPHSEFCIAFHRHFDFIALGATLISDRTFFVMARHVKHPCVLAGFRFP